VPELGETLRPHPGFMLFATQNPPGAAYAGRKQLSRAFRSRFLELHIGDIPESGPPRSRARAPWLWADRTNSFAGR
jgi:midasin (ATPase involved in ribosome maturation)